MSNGDIEAAWTYHNSTKHSVASIRATRHSLDWEIKPQPFKVYPDLEPLALPRELPPARVAALTAIAQETGATRETDVVPDLVSLSRLLHFSAGIIQRKVYPGGEEMYFRAAACTGALYHIDVYVICGDLPGLSAGVYHFGPHNFALHELRTGDYRGSIVQATASEPAIQHAPAILACTSTYWRNSWKYQARAYRHCFWDCGTILANLFAVAAADGVPARLVCGFVDGAINSLLGLDTAREATLALVALGRVPQAASPPPPEIPAISHRTLPLSPREVDYPAIRQVHAASSLLAPEEVQAWRAARPSHRAVVTAPPSGRLFPLRPVEKDASSSDSIDNVIRRRGSSRRFSLETLQLGQLATLLERTACGVDSDFASWFKEVYLIVQAVEGLPTGSYVYHPEDEAVELLKEGDFRRQAGFLGLGQDLPAEAAVNFYFMCDLAAALTRFGNRGYRLAQLEAAIGGGKVYLAAYALGLGATGLTFFDDDVTEFFSPHAAGKSVMFLVAVGHPRRTLPLA